MVKVCNYQSCQLASLIIYNIAHLSQWAQPAWPTRFLGNLYHILIQSILHRMVPGKVFITLNLLNERMEIDFEISNYARKAVLSVLPRKSNYICDKEFVIIIIIIIIIIYFIIRIYTAKSRPSTPKCQRCLSSAISSSNVSVSHEDRHLVLP